VLLIEAHKLVLTIKVAYVIQTSEGDTKSGNWGYSPQWGPGAEPLVRGSKPPESESF